MSNIAIFDDRVDQRETVARLIKLELKKIGIDWEVQSYPPLANISDYPRWINQHGINLLIVDERLHEVASNDEDNVDYDGHDLVLKLRETHADLPIFVITSWSGDESLEANAGEFEDVIKRGDFTRNCQPYVKRFIRATTRMIDSHEAELVRLATLSEKAALGNASEGDYDEIRQIQQKLSIPFLSEFLGTRESWIEDLEKSMHRIEELEKVIKSRLDEMES